MAATDMDLKELPEKTADSDFLREMIGFTAQRLIELEVETLTGVNRGARSADHLPYRTDTRPLSDGAFRLGLCRGHRYRGPCRCRLGTAEGVGSVEMSFTADACQTSTL
jgi:hypothetical protein